MVEWPHPTRTVSTTAASCPWHQYTCCVPLLNRTEHPRFIDAHYWKRMAKARRFQNMSQSYPLGMEIDICFALSSNSERNKRSFPFPGASCLNFTCKWLSMQSSFLWILQRALRVFGILDPPLTDPQPTVHASWHHACAVLYAGQLPWTRMGKWAPKMSYPTSVQPYPVLTWLFEYLPVFET